MQVDKVKHDILKELKDVFAQAHKRRDKHMRRLNTATSFNRKEMSQG